MSFSVPGDATHPLNAFRWNADFVVFAGTPDPEHSVRSREISPRLPDGYVHNHILDVVHGAPVVVTESTDLPSAEIVQNIATLLMTDQVVLRLAGDVRKRTGLLYRANGAGPFPEDLDE